MAQYQSKIAIVEARQYEGAEQAKAEDDAKLKAAQDAEAAFQAAQSALKSE